MFDLNGTKKIVIKVGSSLIINEDGGHLVINSEWLKTLASDVIYLRKSGIDVIVVSSGAIAFAKSILYPNFIPKNSDLTVAKKQSLAAFGQVKLMNLYSEIFAAHNINVAQILMTAHDNKDQNSRSNIQAAISELIASDMIPIINENDVVATDEIKIGDNDTLSAIVSATVGADSLFLLSDIDGLYDKNPHLNSDAILIREVRDIDQSILNIAGDSLSSVGTGGMRTKVLAAQIAKQANCKTIIISGKHNNPIRQFLNTHTGTVFY